MKKALGRMEAFDALLEALATEPAPPRKANRQASQTGKRRRPDPLPAVPTPPHEPQRAAGVLHP